MNIVLYPFIEIYNFYKHRLLPEKYVIRKNFKKHLGVYPNLEKPQTFNEKPQWLKLYDRTPLHTLCADKYNIREYVKDKTGESYLIPLAF